MKVIRFFLILVPILSIGQQRFNDFREQLIKNKTYEYVYGFENNYAVFRTFNDKMGVIDSTGNVIIKPKFKYINNQKELKNLFEVGNTVNKKFKRGYIDLKGNIKIPLEYDDIYYFGKDLIRVSKNNKTGVIDTLNKVILPLKYDYIMHYNDVLFVQTNDAIDLFDVAGKQLTNFQAKDIEYFTDTETIVTLKNNTTFIINDKGVVILNSIKNIHFEKIINSHTYIVRNILTNKKGIINASGKYEIECKYNDILPSKSIYIVKNKDKFGIIDKNDTTLKPFVFDGISSLGYDEDTIHFKNQYKVSKGDLQGIINPFSEKEIIPLRYKYIQPFSDYYITANSENKNGLFSENGTLIIPEDYEFYNASKNKIFAVKNAKNYLIAIEDKKYAEIEVPADQFVKELFSWGISKSNYQIFKKGNKFGVMSNENKIVIPCEFDTIQNTYSTTEFIVKKNKKYGVINTKNEVLLEIKYDTFKTMKEVIKFDIKNKKETKYHSLNFSSELL
ncbi:WG repeat-containing protein [Flavobacterium sp. MC2016-06]|uniref:WG repeat-containing protein n=1 Tax=Flavobacterium sp. MC2016-06 TaxID=2676308 RepID=UPI0012BB19ED|nr:WG repeat-containing protein [Flavobacterium sp. MC2016-06]MBU3859428.1 WG repeat-containing protein [Flavobacterium sp. MC2016-06]